MWELQANRHVVTEAPIVNDTTRKSAQAFWSSEISLIPGSLSNTRAVS